MAIACINEYRRAGIKFVSVFHQLKTKIKTINRIRATRLIIITRQKYLMIYHFAEVLRSAKSVAIRFDFDHVQQHDEKREKNERIATEIVLNVVLVTFCRV